MKKLLLTLLLLPTLLIAQDQIGEDINGEAEGDYSGSGVSLSSDGSIVAIGATNNNGNGNVSGHVRVYENISGVWTQIGSDINGEAEGDYSGFAVSLSSDGSIIAIGSGKNDNDNGYNSGHVRVYENIAGVWTQIGEDIDGEGNLDNSGRSLSLSSDGSIVAIGAPSNNSLYNEGRVRVYENVRGVWTQIGEAINGENNQDYSGRHLSLSSDGSIVAIGATYNDGNGYQSGHVRVYDLSTLLSTESFKFDYFNIYPNPAQHVINIELNQGVELEKVNIYNTLGQFISTTQDLKINTSNFTSGVYFIEIETTKGKSAKKIVIE